MENDISSKVLKFVDNTKVKKIKLNDLFHINQLSSVIKDMRL